MLTKSHLKTYSFTVSLFLAKLNNFVLLNLMLTQFVYSLSSSELTIAKYNLQIFIWYLIFFFCYAFLTPGNKQAVPNHEKCESKIHSSQRNKRKRLESLSCVLKGTVRIVLNIVFRNCNRNQHDKPTTYWNILLSISLIFIDLGDSYICFILIFINMNTYRLPCQIFLFCNSVELYSQKEPYTKLISNTLCNLITLWFFPNFGQKKRLDIIVITTVSCIFGGGGNYISQD